MVHTLYNKLQIPVYGQFDCNPHGIAIYLQYARGGNPLLGGIKLAVPMVYV